MDDIYGLYCEDYSINRYRNMVIISKNINEVISKVNDVCNMINSNDKSYRSGTCYTFFRLHDINLNSSDITVYTVGYQISDKNCDKLKLNYYLPTHDGLHQLLMTELASYRRMINILDIKKTVSNMPRNERILYINEHDDIDKYNINTDCCSILFGLDDTKQIVIMIMKKQLESN